MIVLAAMGLLTVGSWVVALALVGRSTFPVRERMALRSWRLADLRRNAARGAREMSTFDARVRRVPARGERPVSSRGGAVRGADLAPRRP